ncbi:short-chain dehydrogenase/reductase SDR [Saccharopolyspora erythraea NRRL 2338]|uniref:Short-chain dehydrogenase/reductase SDR n=1 Tax=Saccharopolyspora erythraea (strain ATCC 11635 / DSM 40517 / JCM 4748 / NBRC 13426 / NCIMB 8594 / NRRL 2338) TaxID=405948 RepID=A4FGT1_SACEN|nr:short-chain dehydrogenase/reductase SDR [Saccharopolyspora erythraea NRRL 2338]
MARRESWAGRVAVVTGAGSGIGRAVALRLARSGAEVAVSDIDEQAARETAGRCGQLGATARPYALDVSDRDAVYAHAAQVAQEFGRVHLVLNNAGVALKAPVRTMSAEQLRRVMDVNFWGVVHGSQAFLPHLIASGRGHLANVSSVFGFIGVPTQSAYNASKFAVRGFTEALRQEMLAERAPVHVSCIHPGGVKTDIARSAGGVGAGEREEVARSFDKIARTTPERAARIILDGISLRRPRILVGSDAYVIDALPRLLGASYQRLVGTIAGRLVR